jgi:hypothetical protein
MALSDIIYKKINDKYSYGKYADFEVIMMTKNSYINVTNICNEYNKIKAPNEPNKTFSHWNESISHKILLEKINEHIQAHRDPDGLVINVTIVDNTSANRLRGTYVHPLIIPHICSWISPDFAIKVSEIVNYHLTMHLRNQNIELSKEISEIKQMNINQNKKIDDLKDINLAQSKEIQNLLGYTKNIDEDINTLIDLSIEQIEETRVASNDRINIPTNACHIENMAIVKSSDPNCKKPYHMIRGIYSYVKVTIGKLTGTKFGRISKSNTDPWLIATVGDPSKYDYVFVKAFSNAGIARTCNPYPNARHLFRAAKEFKDPDGSKIIESAEGTNFSTLASESELLDWIQKVFDNRLTIKIEELDLQKARAEFSKKIKNTKSKLLTNKISSL